MSNDYSTGRISRMGLGQIFKSGQYHFCQPGSASLTSQPTNDQLCLAPFVVAEATQFVRIGSEVTTAGSASSTLRLGIYTDGGGFPASLVIDVGATGTASTVLANGLIDTSVTTMQEVTIALTLQPGLYWAGGVVQGAPATRPFVRGLNNTFQAVGVNSLASLSGAAPIGYGQSSVTGALPATFAGTYGGVGLVPRVYVKAA